VRIGEVDLYARVLGKFFVSAHLLSLVVGHGEPVLCVMVSPSQWPGTAR
jgi:hypothetical protein